jgi:hypothetical protein
MSFALIIGLLMGANRKEDRVLAVLATKPDGTACEEFCLFGAIPEKMSYVRIQELLTAHPLLRGLHIESRPNTYDYFFGETIDVNHREGLVAITFHNSFRCTDNYPECFVQPNHVLLQPLRKNLTLGAIIADFGAPDFVELQAVDFNLSVLFCTIEIVISGSLIGSRGVP